MLFNNNIRSISIPSMTLQYAIYNCEWKSNGAFYANDNRFRIEGNSLWIYTKSSFNEIRIKSFTFNIAKCELVIDGDLCDNETWISEQEEIKANSKTKEEAFNTLLAAAKLREEYGVVEWGGFLLDLKPYLATDEYEGYCKQFIEDYYLDDDGESLYEFSIKLEAKLYEFKELERAEQEHVNSAEFTCKLLDGLLTDLVFEANGDKSDEELKSLILKFSTVFIGNYDELEEYRKDDWNTLVRGLYKKVKESPISKVRSVLKGLIIK